MMATSGAGGGLMRGDDDGREGLFSYVFAGGTDTEVPPASTGAASGQ